MTDGGFIIGCMIIFFGLIYAARSNISISHDVSVRQIDDLIERAITKWHKSKHEAADYYKYQEKPNDTN